MRRVVVILVLLLAGAVVNVAVAWGCAIWIHLGGGPWSTHITAVEPWGKPNGFVGRTDRFGSTQLHATYPSYLVPPSDRHPPPDSMFVPWGRIEPPRESGAGKPPEEEDLGEALGPRVLVDDGRGWPMRSMWCGWSGSMRLPSGRVTGPWEIMHGIALKPVVPGGRERAIPLAVWVPGFAVNTLFYAAILWLLIPGPFALRRLIRRRRGLCPACGYDMKHAEHESCPECGAVYA